MNMKMNTPLRLATIIGLAFCLHACQSDNKTNTTPPPPPPEAAPPSSPKPEVYLYWVTMDKLNLRDQPSKNGKVVTQLAEGGFVEGTGEISANKEEVMLRDIPYNEPYFKVATLTPEKNQGWVYSAALKGVYAGPRSTIPDIAALTELSTYLKSLNVNKLESGKKATDFVSAKFARSNGTLADAAFILLERFLFRMEIEGNYYNLTERQAWTDADYEAIYRETFDMNKYPLTKTLAANGFRLEEGEGMIFPVVDWAKLSDLFTGKVTPPMKEYILQNLTEQKDNAFDDGGLIVGLDTIAERAVFWETFNKQNPYFVRSAETRESAGWLQMVLLNGSDNTPAYDYESKEVTEAFKKVWSMILTKYPGTTLAKKVKELSDICTAEGNKRGPKADEWLLKHNESYNH